MAPAYLYSMNTSVSVETDTKAGTARFKSTSKCSTNEPQSSSMETITSRTGVEAVAGKRTITRYEYKIYQVYEIS